jgi:hypothetical protein
MVRKNFVFDEKGAKHLEILAKERLWDDLEQRRWFRDERDRSDG